MVAAVGGNTSESRPVSTYLARCASMSGIFVSRFATPRAYLIGSVLGTSADQNIKSTI
jgi:hypothetical protein